MRASRAPATIFVLLLGAAALTLLSGVFLAKREHTEREPVGRGELSEFGGALIEELRRLDKLYASHLSFVAESVERGSEISIRAGGDHLIGLRQISIVPLEGRGTHVEIATGDGRGRAAIPVRAGNQVEGSVGRESFHFEPPALDGFLADPEWFVVRRFDLDGHVVLNVDRAAVLDATRDWVAGWYSGEFEPVAVTGAKVAFDSPSGAILAGDAARAPDYVLPLRTRFGRWKLSSWDKLTTTVSYHAPTLAVSSVLAIALAAIGVAAFWHQRRWQRLAEQRVSFVNRVSHELRTPLTNILLNTDLASDTMETSPREAARRMGLVREEASRLSRLIGNVLTFSKGERGELQLSPRPVELQHLVDSVLAPFRPALRRRGIEVRLDLEPGAAALADADASAQVLANLVSNVEKYAACGGVLEIGCGVSAGGTWLAVGDRGPGIPAGDEDRIFTAFERLGERIDEGVSGTGLGLAIARDLARQMGGELRCEQRPRGARFVLDLPAAPENVVALEAGNRSA